MALIVWDESMKLGVASVDHEHEELIGEINTLGEMIEQGTSVSSVQGSLGKIHAQIEGHFALEEKIMRERAYSGYYAHKEDHEDLLESIRDIMDSVTEDTYKDVSGELGLRLRAWFSEHFRTLDRAFHSFADH
ncbi:MAG: hemerythrin family protein [Magnetovibrio sp.]|nr:hemerythrin family protein [Magnetovibrio sp.]